MEGENVEDMPRLWKWRKQGKFDAAAGDLEEASTNKRCLLLGYQDNEREMPGTSVRGLQIIGKTECGYALKT